MTDALSPLEEASDPATPGERLRQLCNGSGPVITAVLRNPSCPSQLLRNALSAIPSAWTNPSLPLLILSCEVSESELKKWALLCPDMHPEAPAWVHELRNSILGLRERAKSRRGKPWQIGGDTITVTDAFVKTAVVLQKLDVLVPFAPEDMKVSVRNSGVSEGSIFAPQMDRYLELANDVTIKAVVASSADDDRPLLSKDEPASSFDAYSYDTRAAVRSLSGPKFHEPNGETAICLPGDKIKVALEIRARCPMDVRFVIVGQGFPREVR